MFSNILINRKIQNSFLKYFSLIFVFNTLSVISQVKEENPVLKYGTWAILQAIPLQPILRIEMGKFTHKVWLLSGR
jgi:hypothetical protein